MKKIEVFKGCFEVLRQHIYILFTTVLGNIAKAPHLYAKIGLLYTPCFEKTLLLFANTLT